MFQPSSLDTILNSDLLTPATVDDFREDDYRQPITPSTSSTDDYQLFYNSNMGDDKPSYPYPTHLESHSKLCGFS